MDPLSWSYKSSCRGQRIPVPHNGGAPQNKKESEDLSLSFLIGSHFSYAAFFPCICRTFAHRFLWAAAIFRRAIKESVRVGRDPRALSLVPFRPTSFPITSIAWSNFVRSCFSSSNTPVEIRHCIPPHIVFGITAPSILHGSLDPGVSLT